MIEIPVVKPPDVLTDLLAEFRPLFDRRQFRQFSRYISSSWVSPTRSVAHLNGIFMEHTNQSSLNRFLRKERFSVGENCSSIGNAEENYGCSVQKDPKR